MRSENITKLEVANMVIHEESPLKPETVKTHKEVINNSNDYTRNQDLKIRPLTETSIKEFDELDSA